MPYQSNIPAATDQLSVSQGDLQGNFQFVGAICGNGQPNSPSLAAVAGFNYLFLASGGTNPPTGTTFGANVAMYSFLNATTNKNELYISKQNQATTTMIPATASILSINSAPGNNSNGWSYLPSGVLIQWGITPNCGLGSNAFNFPIAFPNACFNIQVSARGNGVVDQNTAFYASILNNVQYNVFMTTRVAGGTNAPLQAYFFAIGN